MARVSVIGLGAMGRALAGALTAAGEEVTVWNRTAARAEGLGAAVAATPAKAVAASPVTIVCVTTHEDTRALLDQIGDAARGRTIVDLSTGSAEEADALARALAAAGARWQIGMINVYPRDIATPGASIYTVGPEDAWQEVSAALRILGPASRRVGAEPRMLAALFAAMFTTRQGFMCGMLHGAAVANAAGVSPEIFAETLPLSVGLAEAYSETFRRTVLKGTYDDPGASISTYAAAFDDALGTFTSNGAPAGLPRFMADLVREAAAAGYADKELTAIYEMLVSRIARPSA